MTLLVRHCIPQLTITLPLVIVTPCQNDTGALNQEVQTELTCQNISEFELDNRARVVESSCLKSCTIYDREMYVGALDKVSFYNGLPMW